MKVFQLLFYVFIVINSSFARHGKGGSITYEYLGQGASPGTSKYKIVVKHYIDCAGIQFIEPSSFVGIFTGGNNLLYNKLVVPESYRETNQKMSFDRCINQPPDVCYVVVSYVTETELPDNIFGYTIAEQECCRILGIINVPNSSSYGITNTNTIPGVIEGVVYRTNSSPVFAQKDTVVICQGSYFSLDFSAKDINGDILKYAFTPAKSGGSVQTRQPDPPQSPPYTDLPYQGSYTAQEPLGAGVTINANTGIISGIAPATLGSYIIAVTASEYRNGILIGISKKKCRLPLPNARFRQPFLSRNILTARTSPLVSRMNLSSQM